MKSDQERYVEMQMLSNEAQQLQQRIQNAEKQISELKNLDDTLTEFSKSKEGAETLAPIGNGIFIKTELKNTKEVVMAVGANMSVTKSVEDAKKVVDEQTKEMERIAVELEKALTETTSQLYHLQEEMQKNHKKDQE